MKQPVWQKITLSSDKVPARPSGLWTPICEYVEGAITLRFKATGEWTYAKERKCGPDGVRTMGFPQDALVPSAPLGSLVGKVGGSPNDKPDTTKAGVFSVGSGGVVILEGTTKGTLFLTMNDEPTQFNNHDGELQIELWEMVALR